MTSVTVRVYSKKLSLPVGLLSGSVTFKLAHLLEPEDTISVYVLFFFFLQKIAAYFVPISHIGETNIDCNSERCMHRHDAPFATHFAKSALLRAHVGSTYLNVFQMANALFKRLTLELCPFKGKKRERE